MFCKATELYMRENFISVIQSQFKDAKKKDNDYTTGYIAKKINDNIDTFIRLLNDKYYNGIWWKIYGKKLKDINVLRRSCCHPDNFLLEDEQNLKRLLFDEEVFKNLRVGKKIAKNIEKLNIKYSQS